MSIPDFFGNYEIFLMVLIRMTGMIMFSPIFGKNNIPGYFKMGLSLGISILMAGTLEGITLEIDSFVEFLIIGLQELAIGFVIGFIIQLFTSVFHTGGELIDYQIGFSFSKSMDPASDVSSSVITQVLNIFFTTSFFLIGAHLTLIKISCLSYNVIGVAQGLNFEVGAQYIVELIGLIFTYAIKLAIPVIAIEFVTEVGIGIMMKAIPQINVFSVNIQLKMILGVIVVIVLLPAFGGYIDRIIDILFDKISSGILAFS